MSCRKVPRYWELSFDTALERIDLFLGEGFTAAYAAYELNRKRDAIELLLHAALNGQAQSRQFRQLEGGLRH